MSSHSWLQRKVYVHLVPDKMIKDRLTRDQVVLRALGLVPLLLQAFRNFHASSLARARVWIQTKVVVVVMVVVV